MLRITVCSGGGLGNIVMSTPLVSALASQGHDVFYYLIPDVPELDVSPLFYGGPAKKVSQKNIEGFIKQSDFVLVNYWALKNKPELDVVNPRFIVQRRFNMFASEVEQNMELARNAIIGFHGPTPPSWVIPSKRKFDIPKDSIVIHPGCKKSWYDRKCWPGFGFLSPHFKLSVFTELIEKFNHPIVIQGPEDAWKGDYKNLSLPDLSALINQADCFLGNDAGPMHVSLALNKVTFGIFGPTPVAKAVHPQSGLVGVSLDLPCQKNCNFYDPPIDDCKVRCLNDLSQEQVLETIRQFKPNVLR